MDTGFPGGWSDTALLLFTPPTPTTLTPLSVLVWSGCLPRPKRWKAGNERGDEITAQSVYVGFYPKNAESLLNVREFPGPPQQHQNTKLILANILVSDVLSNSLPQPCVSLRFQMQYEKDTQGASELLECHKQ